MEVERKASGGDAEGHAREVTEIIDSVVQALSPERAATYRQANPVVEALDLARSV